MKVMLLAAAALLATAAIEAPKHYEGASPDGSRWAAEVPANWNGTLLMHSRGGRPDSKDPPMLSPGKSGPLLLEHGYAIAGSSFATPGWNPAGAAASQFLAIPRIIAAIGSKPRHVVNLGTSYGGGTGAQEAERTTGEIDAAIHTCGLIVGGVDLMNAQLDSLHALSVLLGDGKLPLLGLKDADGVKASAVALTGAVRAANATPEGRARLALAASLMHLPEWHDGDAPAPGDMDARAAQQAKWLGVDPGPDVGSFGFIQGSRLDIETRAGGNPSWNAGVDYTKLMRNNVSRPLVEAMYAKAGLDLGKDLARLTAAAQVRADPAAVAWMLKTSVPIGAIRVPVLAMQTTGDAVAPPEFLTLYSQRVAKHGKADWLRTVAVARPGHCQFKPAEILAAADAMRARLDSGQWGDLVTPAALNASAGAEAAFVADPHRPFQSRVTPAAAK